MPIHDWTKVFAGLFHDFHHGWIDSLKRALNDGILPPDYYALAEQVTVGVAPDVTALHQRAAVAEAADWGGLLVAEPKTSVVEALDNGLPRRKNQVAVRHAGNDQTVAVIEIVSPGNKDSRHALRSFLTKTADLLAKGIHILLIDLHPPTKRDPRGIHGALRKELGGGTFTPPEGKPLTLASYQAGAPPMAYVEPVAVGDVLPDMPLYLAPGGYVNVPLEKTYTTAWAAVPRRWRRVIDPNES